MIARKELGLDHLSNPDTQNLREFNSVSGAIFIVSTLMLT
jgi:hypothetical protein